MTRLVIWLQVLCAVLCLHTAAWAGVTLEGEWPDSENKVSLSVTELPRAEALRKLADQAGWSIVVDAPNRQPVDIHIKDQPPRKILELLLTDRDYIVKREGNLVHVSVAKSAGAAESPAAPAGATASARAGDPFAATPKPPATPAPPAAAKTQDDDPDPDPDPDEDEDEDNDSADHGSVEDRVVTGGNTVVEKDEVVQDLVVMGGAADVHGLVKGDLSIMGGSAVLHEGARVLGDASVLGGKLEIQDGARINGGVGVLGGSVERGKGAHIGGKINKAAKSVTVTGGGLLRDAGRALTRTALLFVFGAVLLALATRRMETLEKEIAARPMRTFALGIVGTLLTALVFIVLCVTLVGIPLAVIGALVATFATYVGIAAALTTLGGALIHHKTPNAYAHLALGCLLYLVGSSLPFIGGFVTATLVLIGIGAIFATRGAGYVKRKNENGGPYRTAAV